MTDVEPTPALIEALQRDLPPYAAQADWDDVLRRSGVERRQPRRLAVAFAALAAVLTTLLFATPLGGAIRNTVADFSTWLRGAPGEPVTADEQRAFEEENARSYAAFPGSPQLRRLIRTEVDGSSYDLLGFRSADSLCIRVTAAGEAKGTTTECAPVNDLRNDDTPVRVLLVDWGVGRGDKTAQIGFDTYHAPRAHVSAGIAADGVDFVELADESGAHSVPVRANAFLYVAERPDVEQFVTHVRARMSDGQTVDVPFTQVLWGPGAGMAAAAGRPGGPAEVERVVHGGTIGWLERREERGEPLDTVPGTLFSRDAEFGRVITPDPANGKRIVITVSKPASGPELEPGGVCYAEITQGGSSGGCIGRLDELFRQGPPFSGGYSTAGAGTQYATFGGLASDDVARLEIFTATGNRIDVPLRDNAYLAEVSLARLPAKLVAYDSEGRVIGIQQTPDEERATPTGEPVLRLRAEVAGSSLEFVAVRTKEGGQCWFERGTGNARINGGSCIGRDWSVAPMRVSWLGEPPLFVVGRVRADIRKVVLLYADGERHAVEPEQFGYVLFTIPPEHRSDAGRLVELRGLDDDGEVVARQPVRAPER